MSWWFVRSMEPAGATGTSMAGMRVTMLHAGANPWVCTIKLHARANPRVCTTTLQAGACPWVCTTMLSLEPVLRYVPPCGTLEPTTKLHAGANLSVCKTYVKLCCKLEPTSRYVPLYRRSEPSHGYVPICCTQEPTFGNVRQCCTLEPTPGHVRIDYVDISNSVLTLHIRRQDTEYILMIWARFCLSTILNVVFANGKFTKFLIPTWTKSDQNLISQRKSERTKKIQYRDTIGTRVSLQKYTWGILLLSGYREVLKLLFFQFSFELKTNSSSDNCLKN